MLEKTVIIVDGFLGGSEMIRNT